VRELETALICFTKHMLVVARPMILVNLMFQFTFNIITVYREQKIISKIIKKGK
jgi:hypothetical protein